MADVQVTAWLRAAGLSRFGTRFASAQVATTDFLALAPADLDALGVDSPADRKRLSDLIVELRRARKLPPVQSTTYSTQVHAQKVVQSELQSKSQSFVHSNSQNQNQNPADRLEHLQAQHSSYSWLAGRTPLVPSGPTKSSFGYQRESQHADNDIHGRATTASAALPPHPSSRAASGESPPHSASITPNVRVCVRKRPLSQKDVAAGERDIISTGPNNTLFVHEVKQKLDLSKYVDSHSFTFDSVFTEKHSNVDVYRSTAMPLVDTVFTGGRATCFAYGQTGTGKTYTMEGEPGKPGLYILAVRDVFDRAARDPTLSVWISFFEIYGSRLHDLLNNRAKLECREDTQCEMRIVGLTERRCSRPEHVLSLIRLAAAARSTGVTGANDDSSRSHAVFQIELRRVSGNELSSDYEENSNDTGMDLSDVACSLLGDDSVPTTEPSGTEVGRLSFIDLAGSERGSDTACSNIQTRREGAEINKSLLALKECIRAMDQRKDHTPFRGSKLTQVLKASFTGKVDCRTVMIANVSPASPNVEHTLNTLRYSQRVKEMKSHSPERLSSQAHAYGVPSARNIIPRSMSNNYTMEGKKNTQLANASSHTINTPVAQGHQVYAEKPSSGRTSAVGATPVRAMERRPLPGLLRTNLTLNNLESTPQHSVPVSRLPPSTPCDDDASNQTPMPDRNGTDGLLSNRPGRRRATGSKSMIPTPRSCAISRRPSEELAGLRTEGSSIPSLRPRTRAQTYASIDNAQSEEEGSSSTAFSLCHARSTDVSPVGNAGKRHATQSDGSSSTLQRDGKVFRMNSSPSVTRNSSLSSIGSTGCAEESDWIGPTRDDTRQGNICCSDSSEVADDDLLYDCTPTQPSRTRKIKLPLRRRRQTRAPAADAMEHSEPNMTSATELSKTAKDVVALHREKVEELTMLMKEGSELSRAVEAGQVAPSAYATKLELNLALSMDIIHTLKMQVATLGAQER